MFNSKALKKLPRLRSREYKSNFDKIVQKIKEFFLFNFYYPPIDFIRRFKERSGRSIAYARFGWLHYDFDSAFLYDLMAFKLRRLHKCLKNGHAFQQKEDMDALKEAIKICDRLHEGRYEDKYYKLFDARWGKMPRFQTKPELDKDGKPTGMFVMVHKERPNVKNEADKKQERKERLKMHENAEEDYKKDIDRLAEILKKHGKNLWD